MAKKYDVVVVGELNVDVIFNTVNQFPAIGKEVLAQQMEMVLGSSSAIFASNLQTMGANVAFVGKTGADAYGDFIRKALQERGVDTSYISTVPGVHTGVTVALNFGEERAMVTHPGAMDHLKLEDITMEILHASKHLHVSSVFLQNELKPAIIALFKTAKEAGLTTSLDPQWDPHEKWDVQWSELLAYVDVFLPNASEIIAITKARDLDHALQVIGKKDNIVAVKNGREGALLWDGQAVLHQLPFVNINVKDSIGAGDSFNAGFIYNFIQSAPLAKCLEQAALMGAVNTTGRGGTGAFRSKEEVKNIALQIFNYHL